MLPPLINHIFTETVILWISKVKPKRDIYEVGVKEEKKRIMLTRRQTQLSGMQWQKKPKIKTKKKQKNSNTNSDKSRSALDFFQQCYTIIKP